MATPQRACRGGRGAAHLAPVLCAFVVLALATLVQGRHASLAYTAEKDAFTAVDLPFGFYAGGSMHTSAAYPAGTTNDVPVTFMLCSFAARDAVSRATRAPPLPTRDPQLRTVARMRHVLYGWRSAVCAVCRLRVGLQQQV